ncbi:MAG: flippase-like domain-containing protein, partial [Deltaproteobacteria bacterium]|nr:flippase-like domain-containing protein [Deltaproteobacteria bacterium]
MARIKFLLLVIASLFLVWMLHAVGWDKILHHLTLLGWHWPLILLPYFLVNLFDTLAWYYSFDRPPAGISIRYLFFNRLAGEAINILTPVGSLGGEPVKAMMLRKEGVPLTDATASLVICKGILVLSLVLYIFLGLAMAPFLFTLSSAWLLVLVAAAVSFGLGALGFVVIQRYGICRLSMEVLEKCKFLPPRLKKHEEALCRLDEQMSTFYRHHIWKFWVAVGLSFVGWLIHGLELYIIFHLLDQPISFPTALCLDALITLISSMAFFIPGNLGVQEGGAVLLTIGLHLGALIGATFSIVRRL